MSADGLAGELPAGDSGRSEAGDPSRVTPDLERTLVICDQFLGEIGRRGHLFTWLRAPGKSTEGWLPVDAYYPRGRLVVLYRPRPTPHDDLYRELVPEHGLRLLELTPAELGSTPAGAKRALAQKLADLTPPPSPEPAATERSLRGLGNPLRRLSLGERPHAPTAPQSSAPPPPPPPATAPASPPPLSAAERGSRFVTARRTARPPRRMESPTLGIVVGVALVLILLVAVVYVTSH
jgi:hypothetical protein